MEKPVIGISVRNLVEFVLQAGDLVSGFQAGARTIEGIRGHQRVQRENELNCSFGETYIPEVPVRYAFESDDLVLEVRGRIDGVIESGGEVTIEEIKTTTRDLDDITADSYPLHWAQAKCYAFIYARENGLERLRIRLTYYQVDTGRTKTLAQRFPLEELKGFFEKLALDYLEWAKTLQRWAGERDASIKALGFPFAGYRAGQREMAVAVFKAVRDGGTAFIQAPTGIGKTMATVFPAVKSVGEGYLSKVFYLTAKTVTRSLAEKAYNALREKGLRFKTVTVTAKEKICFNPGVECDPEECPYAKGYYDRLKAGIRDIFENDAFTRPLIEEYARRHSLCPFEFSLDLSLWADGIVCDYNYVFDPRVYLRRFFSEEAIDESGGAYVFLVDEAHNLVDRAREMFSAELRKEPFLDLKGKLGKKKERDAAVRRLYTALQKINKFMIGARGACAGAGADEGRSFHEQPEMPEDLHGALRSFADAAEKILAGDEPYPFRETLLERFFEVHSMLRTLEFYDERYHTYYEKEGNDVAVKLFCVDPSFLLSQVLKRSRATVFFSATLTPLDYFVQVLGGDEGSIRMKLSSPFPRENLLVLLDNTITTKYRMRHTTYDSIAEEIGIFTGAKTGNYLVYFPSYQYLREVLSRFAARHPGVRTVVQKENMTETGRADFLSAFASYGAETLTGFAVMGGVFGEGIDLVGEHLSGVAVVGVGLPPISFERDLIKDYYRRTLGAGFEYAYIYPGMNKVLQAVGRVIRTETDRGSALLIDERFAEQPYRGLLPMEWQPLRPFRLQYRERAQKLLAGFWSGGER